MQKIPLLALLLLFGSNFAQAQTGGSPSSPCTQANEVLICTTLFEYDDAGNRTLRKEVCACGVPTARAAAPATAAAAQPSTAAAAIAKIFPNPASNSVTVQFSQSISAGVLSISDATGKQLETFEANGTETQINLRQFAAGIYFITLRAAAATDTQRIVKTN